MFIMKFASVVAFAGSALAQQGAYFVLEGGGAPLVIERVDPIVSPGGMSSHSHSIVGGNGWGPTMDYDSTQAATCSTVSPKADKSNYWMPNLFFQDPNNGSFVRVPEQPYHKIYYRFGTFENVPDEEIEEFPKEFRMIAGDAMARAEDKEQMGTGGSQMHWMCHHDNYKIDSATGFPKGFTSCVNGFAADMRFPSCWSGKDYNSTNPTAHMAYPLQGSGRAACPEGFQVKRFPEIFVEYWFDIKSFNDMYDAGDSPWVLANGDPTGYAFHLDFINGWEEGALNTAMKTCNPGNTGVPKLEEDVCFGKLGGAYTDAEMNSCKVKPTSADDEVGWTYGHVDYDGIIAGPWMDKLPGCNPIQEGPAKATKQTCGEEESSPAPVSSLSNKPGSATKTAGGAATKVATPQGGENTDGAYSILPIETVGATSNGRAPLLPPASTFETIPVPTLAAGYTGDDEQDDCDTDD